jgi:hypothetical protein
LLPGPDVCNRQDDDCDGIIDELCNVSVHGQIMGDGGLPAATDGVWSVRQSVGTPRVVGASSDTKFQVRALGALGGEP